MAPTDSSRLFSDAQAEHPSRAPELHGTGLVTEIHGDPEGPDTQRVAFGNTLRGTLPPKKMAADVSVVREVSALRALDAEWRALAATAPGALFRGPDWLLPWWEAYAQTLAAQPHVLVARGDGGELVAIAPLYHRTLKIALLEARELRLMGDAGPRPPALDIVARAGWEDRAGAAFARALIDTATEWDVIDLEPLADPSRVRAAMAQRMATAGFTVESAPSAGGSRRVALGLAEPPDPAALAAIESGSDDATIKKGLSALRRLSRLEWAERDEASPLADAQAAQLLEQVATAAPGRGRIIRLDDPSGEAIAVSLVVDDGDRAVVLAMAVDPQVVANGAPQKLLQAEAAAARARGRTALDVVAGAADYQLPLLPTSRQGALAVRVWSTSTTAAVSRAYRKVQRRARRAVSTPGVAAAQARAAWTRIRTAAANVATFERLCLYRGQLWTRGLASPPGLELGLFPVEDFDKLDEAARAALLEQLELDEAAARRWWARGDLAVLARFGPRPAGIAWSARGPVEVPELGRTLQLSKYEAYIHDVFVASSARGRGVAPVMLEFFARDLRERDVYRSWALIAADNQASLRAFQKASYTSVCDVVHARMASVDRVIVRPPDPEAKALLGL
jgi:GNAT superfamily N-acetyltransferase